MKRHLKTVFLSISVTIVLQAAAQPRIPSPRSVTAPARHARYAASTARDVVETVDDVNEIAASINDAKKRIDSLVADDKSTTPGIIHFILVAVDPKHESLNQLNESLSNISGISNVVKSQSKKSGAIVFEFNSDMQPINIWQRQPAKLQKFYFVNSKDSLNLVLLFKAQPK